VHRQRAAPIPLLIMMTSPRLEALNPNQARQHASGWPRRLRPVTAAAAGPDFNQSPAVQSVLASHWHSVACCYSVAADKGTGAVQYASPRCATTRRDKSIGHALHDVQTCRHLSMQVNSVLTQSKLECNRCCRPCLTPCTVPRPCPRQLPSLARSLASTGSKQQQHSSTRQLVKCLGGLDARAACMHASMQQGPWQAPPLHKQHVGTVLHAALT
jgi:hypothetical protein